MAAFNNGDKVLNDWEIVGVLGTGSFGRVFEVRKSEFGVETKSALKVVSVPPSESEVSSALSEGMDAKSVANYFGGIAQELVKEVAFLSSLGHPHIVAYQDHDAQLHEDGFGWDVLLRMELLTPLTKKLEGENLDTMEVVRLGLEISDALAFCHSNDIIHRDVKPENIFIDPSGHYKLGDFGVSRVAEGTSAAYSFAGAKPYMAPECFKGSGYGKSVDVYALGLVLYRLLNGNRLPFLPPAPQPITFQDRTNAQERRLAGEPLPPIEGCDAALFEVVASACAYDPKARPSAKALHDALESYAHARPEAPVPPPENPEIPVFHGNTPENPSSEEPDDNSGNESASDEKDTSTIGLWGSFGKQPNPELGAIPKPVAPPEVKTNPELDGAPDDTPEGDPTNTQTSNPNGTRRWIPKRVDDEVLKALVSAGFTAGKPDVQPTQPKRFRPYDFFLNYSEKLSEQQRAEYVKHRVFPIGTHVGSGSGMLIQLEKLLNIPGKDTIYLYYINQTTFLRGKVRSGLVCCKSGVYVLCDEYQYDVNKKRFTWDYIQDFAYPLRNGVEFLPSGKGGKAGYIRMTPDGKSLEFRFGTFTDVDPYAAKAIVNLFHTMVEAMRAEN